MSKDEKQQVEVGDRHDISARNFVKGYMPENHPDFQREVKAIAAGRRSHALDLLMRSQDHE